MQSGIFCFLLLAPTANSDFITEDDDLGLSLLQLRHQGKAATAPPTYYDITPAWTAADYEQLVPAEDITPEWCHWDWCQTLEYKNRNARKKWIAEVGPLDEKPDWWERVHGCTVGDNKCKTTAHQKISGACLADLMPITRKFPKGYDVSSLATDPYWNPAKPGWNDNWPPNACPNTLHNIVEQVKNNGDYYDYAKTFPEYSCGSGLARSRDPGVDTLFITVNADEGFVKSFSYFEKGKMAPPGTPESLMLSGSMNSPGGRQMQLRSNEGYARPYIEHMNDAIKMCQQNFLLIQGITCNRKDQLGNYPSIIDGKEDMVKEGSYIGCRCHRKMDMIRPVRKPPSSCLTVTALVAHVLHHAPAKDSDGCPCTNGLSLNLKTPLYSNLGSSGPDTGSPPEIMYPDAGLIGGKVVSVRVWTDEEYKGDGTKNGVKGSLGRLSLKTGHETVFKLAIVDAESEEVVKLQHQLPLTLLDLDEGKKGKGRATVSVCGAQQFLPQSSELTVSSPDGCSSVSSSTRGNSKDNPSSVEGGLTDAVASKRVVSYLLQPTESGIYTFTLKLAKGWGNRNFLFALQSGVACEDDTNMPTGCAAALAKEGL